MAKMFEGATSFDADLSNWDVSQVQDMSDMFLGVTLSTLNYDALLSGWSQQAVQPGLEFHGGGSLFTARAAPARQALIDDHGWAIVDGGQTP